MNMIKEQFKEDDPDAKKNNRKLTESAEIGKILKPFNKHQLIKKITNVLSRVIGCLDDVICVL